ncbi:hypothetical protein HS7_09230 [Sulfolobales archaeon HS-7]|nr:hypothetical protein HS7_09230 [Sulfolobales archaeon HS-7]
MKVKFIRWLGYIIPVIESSTRMKIYYYLLTQNRPVSIRKIQQDLGLSTPSLVLYHIRKLKEEGYITEVPEGYIVNKVILEDYIKIKSKIIPKSLFLSSFYITAILITAIFFFYSPKIAVIYSIIILAVGASISLYDYLNKRNRFEIIPKRKEKNL